MKYELVIENNQNGKAYDATSLIKSVEYETSISGKPGKLSFELIKDESICYFEGNPVRFYVDDKPIFYGYIFSKSRDSNQIIKTTAYDQLRYLKNKDSFALFNKTATEVVRAVAAVFNLRVGNLSDTKHVIPQMIMDNKTGLDTICMALDRTLIATGDMYVFYDDFGKLNLKHINELRTKLVIGDKSLATDYKYKSSIDENVTNQVKIMRKNKDTGKREIYIVKDSTNIAKWGILQEFDKAKNGENKAQIQQRAENMLKLRNKVYRELSIPCLGDFRVRAGTGVYVYLPDIGDISYDQYFIVESVKHKISKEEHTMDIDLIMV
ncbi:XkdQ/YqbQ family protein [Abyssisolibacter fermentans]|uniref:XkdQ/YqbQ family protein n=1 Tax=Abyssisolibacter fermentans TaxID=1766203 RepID=UPI00082DFE53|nr:hypothetical protein [Abyssisolibacter fermentans]